MLKSFWRIWRGPVLAAFAFVALAEAILLSPRLWAGGHISPLPPAELISLLSGAITAAGLTAIYFQFREGNRAAGRAAVEVALRLDDLHVAFNAPDMQVHRDIGWHYLKAVARDSDKLAKFARWWVLSEGSAPDINESAEDRPKGMVSHTSAGWAVTAMVTFYVRLENHFALHFANHEPAPEAFLTATGPFVWKYWEADMMKFVEVCSKLEFRDRKKRVVEPYFVVPLRNLANRYERSANGRAGRRHSEPLQVPD
jgi:hypothetical protein